MGTSHSRQRGFTLIEMMITVTIAAILMAIVVPSFRTFTFSQRVKSGSFDVYATLMFARSEAVKRRAIVTVTPKVSGDWNSGWKVETAAVSGDLRSQDLPKGLAITSGATSLAYGPDGRTQTPANDAWLLLASSDSAVADAAGPRCVSVDVTGMPRTRILANVSAPCP